MTIATAGKLLWDGLSHWIAAAETLRVLDELLVVLMLVEILHTVRISIRSHVLVTEPFLVVGLIASIRRILVITLEAAALSKEGSWSTAGASSVFRGSMVELALLGLLVLIFVFSVTLLRRYAPRAGVVVRGGAGDDLTPGVHQVFTIDLPAGASSCRAVGSSSTTGALPPATRMPPARTGTRAGTSCAGSVGGFTLTCTAQRGIAR